MLGSETIYVELSEVSDPETGAVKQMQSPLLIDISKSTPRYVYPLVYERDFPYYAYEQVIQTSKFGCEDDFSGESEPTCGWQIDLISGEKIPFSQGFCCECDLLNIVGDEATRGSDCDLFNFGSGSSSAHCLKFSEEQNWFKAYTIQAPKLIYTIEIVFSLPVENGETGEKSFKEEVLHLGDFQRNARSDSALIEIVGDFMAIQEPPSLENKVLLLPKYDIFD